MHKIPDEQIVERLKSSDERVVDEVFVYLHQTMFQRMAKFVENNSGSLPDAKDLFQDSLVVLYKMAKLDKLPIGIVVEGYLFSICRNLWYKELNKRKNTVEWTDLSHAENLVEPPLTSLMSEEKQESIEKLFGQLGENCRKLLMSYYFDRIPLKEIASMLNYASEQVAKNKKSLCMSKLKALASEMPGLRNLINS